MNPAQTQLALKLFEIGAIQFGTFKLKLHEKEPEAPPSPIYLNLRTKTNPKPGPLGDEEIASAAREMLALANAEKIAFTLAAGVPNAGDPFAETLCRLIASQGHSIGYLALNKASSGDRRMVATLKQGAFRSGDTAVVVDDLITKADSKFEAIDVLIGHGLMVRDILVLVDREQGGREELARRGFRLHAVFTLTDLLNLYVVACRITHGKRDEVLRYLRTTR